MAMLSSGTRILVPLDGSPVSESALPIAEYLAKATGRSLAFIRVIPITTWAYAGPNPLVPSAFYQELLEDEEAAAQDYLDGVAKRVEAHDIPVTTLMMRGEPGQTVLENCERQQVGLVVMTTHGRTGMARMALGSVADHLVRHSHIPVLLLRPTEGGGCGYETLEHAVMPLDGTPAAEAALDLIDVLAGAVVREVTLLRAVSASGQPGADEEAARYLDGVQQRVMSRLGDRDCSISTRILHGQAGDRIVDQARAGCDLVIMATRGETGTRRWLFGSTADRVLHDCQTPLLLIHPPGA